MYVDCHKCNQMKSHIPCLANYFTTEELLPILGDCPKCKYQLIWGDLIKATKLRISQENGKVILDEEEDEEEEEGEEEESDDTATIANEEESSTPTSMSIDDFSLLVKNSISNGNDSDSSSSSFINLT